MNIYIKVLVQSTSGPIYGENDKFVYFNFQTDNIVKYFFLLLHVYSNFKSSNTCMQYLVKMHTQSSKAIIDIKENINN